MLGVFILMEFIDLGHEHSIFVVHGIEYMHTQTGRPIMFSSERGGDCHFYSRNQDNKEFYTAPEGYHLFH